MDFIIEDLVIVPKSSLSNVSKRIPNFFSIGFSSSFLSLERLSRRKGSISMIHTRIRTIPIKAILDILQISVVR